MDGRCGLASASRRVHSSQAAMTGIRNPWLYSSWTVQRRSSSLSPPPNPMKATKRHAATRAARAIALAGADLASTARSDFINIFDATPCVTPRRGLAFQRRKVNPFSRISRSIGRGTAVNDSFRRCSLRRLCNTSRAPIKRASMWRVPAKLMNTSFSLPRPPADRGRLSRGSVWWRCRICRAQPSPALRTV